jgi:polysaccharide biosynthesis transport protein
MDARSELPATTTPQYNYPDTYPTPAVGSPLGGLTQVLTTLRRAWRLPVLGASIGLTIAVCYVALAPTLYKSTARIILDTSMSRYLQASKLADAPFFDDAQMASQIYILSSESIILPVIRSMELANDSEFVGSPISAHPSTWQSVKNEIKRLVGWNDDAPSIAPHVAMEQKALETFLQRLSVYREDVPNVITIAFSSKDANKAAEVANAIADTYITSTVENKLKSTQLLGQWLQDRVTNLKAQSAAADQALQDYVTGNNLVNTNKGSLNTEQLSDLNAQLANARIAVAQAKARLDGINLQSGDVKRPSGAGNPSVPKANVVLNNSDIAKLRSELRDVSTREATLESELGRNHAAVVKLRKQMDELRASIRDQEQLIADTYANDYEMAKTRETELASAVAKLTGQARADNQTQAKLRELESSAETLRALYNSAIQKYKELLQTESLPTDSARIITKAVPPLYKSNKKSLAILAGGVMAGFLLGAGGALGREWVADVFRTPKAVEEWVNINCAVLPAIERKRRISGKDGEPTTLAEYVLDAPFSRFTESLRSIKAMISAAQLMEGAKVIGIVSSLPEEGKTTIAANLAALMVASSGARTLLIDSDVHLRRLTAELAPQARQGLVEALMEPTWLESLVVRRNRSGLDILPCVLPSRVPNAAEILGSTKMELLVAEARRRYDYIVIEIAPIMSVADIKFVERFVDKFVFIVEWGQTKRSVVLEALTESQVIRDRILGMVLNKVDALGMRSIEANKGGKFANYYHE